MTNQQEEPQQGMAITLPIHSELTLGVFLSVLVHFAAQGVLFATTQFGTTPMDLVHYKLACALAVSLLVVLVVAVVLLVGSLCTSPAAIKETEVSCEKAAPETCFSYAKLALGAIGGSLLEWACTVLEAPWWALWAPILLLLVAVKVVGRKNARKEDPAQQQEEDANDLRVPFIQVV